MKIRMKATAAGPDGVMLPEHIYEVDTATGKALVEGGYAESLDQPVVKKKATTPTPTPTGDGDNSGEGQEPQ